MADVMKIAQDHRAELQDELARMDAFIRMAEALLGRVQPSAAETEDEPQDSSPDSAADAPREVSPGAMRMHLMRRSPALVAG